METQLSFSGRTQSCTHRYGEDSSFVENLPFLQSVTSTTVSDSNRNRLCEIGLHRLVLGLRSITIVYRRVWSKQLSQRQPIQIMMFFNCSELSLQTWAKWESIVVAERQNHNGARTVAPNFLQNDPVLTKFSNCARFLTTMLGSRMFADNPTCD